MAKALAPDDNPLPNSGEPTDRSAGTDTIDMPSSQNADSKKADAAVTEAAVADRNPELRAAEDDVFGKNALRGRDGAPIERGAGSAFARASSADKAHLAAVEHRGIVTDVEAAAKVLVDQTKRLTDSAKKMLDASASAKAERADAVRASPQTPES